MFGKDGVLVCASFLAYGRRQPCKACVEEARARGESGDAIPRGSDPHHFPAKGMGGATWRDDRIIPLCRRHHEQAQAYVIPRETQERWVAEVRSEFLEECSVEELRAYFDALEVWKDRPLAVPF